MTKQAEYRRWLHSKGLCCDCKQRDAFTLNGRWRCAECGEKYNQRQSERRKAGAQAKENASARAQYAERKATGLCVQCRKPAVSGKARCPRCLKRDCKAKKESFRRRHPETNLPRGDNGFCWLCNKKPSLDGQRLCQSCRDLCAAQALKLPRDRSGHFWKALNYATFVQARANPAFR